MRWVGHTTCTAKIINALYYVNVVGKSQRQFERTKSIWLHNITMDLNYIACKILDRLNRLGDGAMASSYEHNNESSAFVKGWEHLDQECVYNLFKIGCAQWS
jgi:hypothetical protein